MADKRKLLVAISLAVFVAFAIYYFQPEDTPPVNTTANRPAESIARTNAPEVVGNEKSKIVNVPDTVAPEPADLGLSTEQLFEGLIKAKDADDYYAATQLVKQLRRSKDTDVIPTAKKYLELVANRDTDKAFDAMQLQFYILAVFADRDPEHAFEQVRKDWTMNAEEASMATDWQKFQGFEVSHLASRFRGSTLSLSKNYISASALANLITPPTVGIGQNNYLLLLHWLRTSYSEVRKAHELPDPWLSHLISEMRAYWEGYNESQKSEIRLFLKWIAESDDFSERLVAEAEALAQNDPRSFWEMMDIVANAKSPQAVANALVALLEKRALTTEEQRMFVEAFHKRFGSGMPQVLTVMGLVAAINGKVPIEHIQSFAADSIKNALSSDEAAITEAHIEFIYTTYIAWLVKTSNSAQVERILVRDYVDMDSIMKLIKKTTKTTDDGTQTVSTALHFIWLSDISASEKVLLTNKAIEGVDSLDLGAFLGVSYGLSDCYSDFRFSDAENVAKLLDMYTSKSPDFLDTIAKTKKREFSEPLLSETELYVRQIARVLQAIGYPPIPDSLKDTLSLMLEIYDSKEAKDAGRHPDIVEFSSVLSKKYTLHFGNKGD